MSRTPDAIPRFRRYGEQTGDAELQPVHVEPIPVRSRLHNWEIRPHCHDGLHHLFLMTAGGGLVSIDGVQRGFRAPALVVVPAPMVHGFSYQPDSDGQVLTALEPALAGVPAGLMEPPMLAAIRTPSVIGLDDRPEELESLRQGFAGIERELRSTAPGRTGAVAAHLVLILVTIARLDLAGDADAARPSRMGRARTPGPAALVDRFRQAIDRHFGEHWTVGAYARALGVTESRLNTACRRVAGRSALHLVHARLLLESKRDLIYTALGIAEIGYALGFEDPAYFSRFFTKLEGCPPSTFRERHRLMKTVMDS